MQCTTGGPHGFKTGVTFFLLTPPPSTSQEGAHSSPPLPGSRRADVVKIHGQREGRLPGEYLKRVVYILFKIYISNLVHQHRKTV